MDAVPPATALRPSSCHCVARPGTRYGAKVPEPAVLLPTSVERPDARRRAVLSLFVVEKPGSHRAHGSSLPTVGLASEVVRMRGRALNPLALVMAAAVLRNGDGCVVRSRVSRLTSRSRSSSATTPPASPLTCWTVRSTPASGRKPDRGGRPCSRRSRRPGGGATLTRNNIFAFDATSGTIDTTFVPNINGEVKALALGPDGGIFVGGTFATVNGVTARRLAKLNAISGQLVTAFASQPSGAVRDSRCGDRPCTWEARSSRSRIWRGRISRRWTRRPGQSARTSTCRSRTLAKQASTPPCTSSR